jgi:hypothetical protein
MREKKNELSPFLLLSAFLGCLCVCAIDLKSWGKITQRNPPGAISANYK